MDTLGVKLEREERMHRDLVKFLFLDAIVLGAESG